MPRSASSQPSQPGEPSEIAGDDVRNRILDTAQSLFYARGVRAVGIDLILSPAESSALLRSAGEQLAASAVSRSPKARRAK